MLQSINPLMPWLYIISLKLISSQALSKIFWKFKIWKSCAFWSWIVLYQVQVSQDI